MSRSPTLPWEEGTRIILEGIVGSTAYGLAGPDSDEDRLAVHVDPVRDVLSLGWKPGTRHTTNPDFTSHEVAKFCDLALACNPTILELLWLPDDLYVARSPLGDQLIELREAFLSKKAAKTYGGYARQQAHRLVQRGGTFDPDLTKRTAKHARHCWRLILAAEHLATKGCPLIELSSEQAKTCITAGLSAETNPEWFLRETELILVKVDDVFAGSDLPDKPDRDLVNDWLVRLRIRVLAGDR